MASDVPDKIESDVVLRTIELPWSQMQDIAAGNPYFVDAGDELICVVRDTHVDDVIAAFDENLDELTVVDTEEVS